MERKKGAQSDFHAEALKHSNNGGDNTRDWEKATAATEPQ